MLDGLERLEGLVQEVRVMLDLPSSAMMGTCRKLTSRRKQNRTSTKMRNEKKKDRIMIKKYLTNHKKIFN